jgi:hypothetical protein
MFIAWVKFRAFNTKTGGKYNKDFSLKGQDRCRISKTLGFHLNIRGSYVF